jgi:predicted GNAT superfamily acetyltransferase
MIIYTTSQTDADLQQIIELQRENLVRHLDQKEIEEQGFVTVVHQLEDLKKMNEVEQSVVAKHNDRVIAYLIAMTVAARNDIPVLVPMFELFGRLEYEHKPISQWRYMVVGQVCVAKAYRGQGVLDAAYNEYKNQFQHRYDFAITEIAVSNQRSLKGHQRVGFKEIHRYTAPDGETWSIVLWNWR